MSKIQKIQIIILFLIFCSLLFYNSVKAAKLDLTSEIQEISINQQFQIDLVLDTENEEINAVEGRILFPKDLLELKEIRDGNSIINFWIERPRIEQTGAIVFSGIIPGGYQETKGFLFSVVFRAKANGNGAIEIRGAKVLLNDGEGTPAGTKIFNFQFSISEQTPDSEFKIPSLKDTDLPEEFKPEIVQNADMFDGKYFLVFATQDKGSGIDHYELCEKSKTNCVIAESPYVLRDQKLRSYIYVKVIDRAGNERIETVPPKYPLKWYETWWIWGIIILGALLAIIIGYLIRKFLWRKLYTKIHK